MLGTLCSKRRRELEGAACERATIGIHPSHPPPLKSGRRVLRPTSPASVHQLVLVFACRPSDIPPNVRGPVSTDCDGVGLARPGNPPVESEVDPLSANPEWARRRVFDLSWRCLQPGQSIPVSLMGRRGERGQEKGGG